MIVSSAQIKKELLEVWPKLVFKVMSDPVWLNITPQALEAELPDPLDIFIPGAFECEEHAIDLVVRQRRKWAERIIDENLPESQWHNWPIGWVFGTKYDGEDMDHWWCIARTNAGIRMIEPQKRQTRIWVPDVRRDHIDILFM